MLDFLLKSIDGWLVIIITISIVIGIISFARNKSPGKFVKILLGGLIVFALIYCIGLLMWGNSF